MYFTKGMLVSKCASKCRSSQRYKPKYTGILIFWNEHHHRSPHIWGMKTLIFWLNHVTLNLSVEKAQIYFPGHDSRLSISSIPLAWVLTVFLGQKRPKPITILSLHHLLLQTGTNVKHQSHNEAPGRLVFSVGGKSTFQNLKLKGSFFLTLWKVCSLQHLDQDFNIVPLSLYHT